MNKKAIVIASLLTATITVNAAPSNQEIMDMMLELKKEVKELKTENKALKGEVEDVAVATDEAIKAQTKLSNKTTIGGYGEIHANWLEDKKGTKDTDKIDFHRFVLFVNHEYSDKLRFVSELELEHSIAGEGKAGEIELEQAYIEYDYNDLTSISAGLMILPVGIINETHEPNTFYGVERNPVEKNIIPATWWEGGVMVQRQLDEGLELKVLAHSGLKATKSFKPRDARGKVGKASAEHLAYTAALKYTKIPGLTLGGAINIQSDMSNGEQKGEQVGANSAIMSEGHMVYEKGNFGLRALYARWDINGADVETAGRDNQDGWYVEPSLKVTDEVGLFARYSKWDNGATEGSGSSAIKQADIGVNWWIDPQVVVKADYQFQNVGAAISNEYRGFNLGLGYAF